MKAADLILLPLPESRNSIRAVAPLARQSKQHTCFCCPCPKVEAAYVLLLPLPESRSSIRAFAALARKSKQHTCFCCRCPKVEAAYVILLLLPESPKQHTCFCRPCPKVEAAYVLLLPWPESEAAYVLLLPLPESRSSIRDFAAFARKSKQHTCFCCPCPTVKAADVIFAALARKSKQHTCFCCPCPKVEAAYVILLLSPESRMLLRLSGKGSKSTYAASTFGRKQQNHVCCFDFGQEQQKSRLLLSLSGKGSKITSAAFIFGQSVRFQRTSDILILECLVQMEARKLLFSELSRCGFPSSNCSTELRTAHCQSSWPPWPKTSSSSRGSSGPCKRRSSATVTHSTRRWMAWRCSWSRRGQKDSHE